MYAQAQIYVNPTRGVQFSYFYMCGFRADHASLDNQQGSSSLGKVSPPSPSKSHLLFFGSWWDPVKLSASPY